MSESITRHDDRVTTVTYRPSEVRYVVTTKTSGVVILRYAPKHTLVYIPD
jgi:hypothetical protein